MRNMLVWITKTSRAGDTNTRIGIAEHISKVWRELEMPTQVIEGSNAFQYLLEKGLISNTSPVWPDVIIGPCFHIPFMSEVKKLSNSKTIIVALRPPVRGLPIKADSADIHNTDLLISYPYHNNTGLPNLFICETLAHRVTPKHLEKGKNEFFDVFSKYKENRPIIGVLVGGDIGIQRRIFPAHIAKELGLTLNKLGLQSKGSLLISFSHRTSDEVAEAIMSEITVPNYVYNPINSDSKNPYFGILAFSDYLVVTADSVSMCSEAVSTGKPVYIFRRDEIVELSHDASVSNLVKKGLARLLSKKSGIEKYSYVPINSAQQISEKIKYLVKQN